MRSKFVVAMVSVCALAGLLAGSCCTPGPSSEKAIISFSFVSPAADGQIDEASHTVVVTVPPGTVLLALVPTIEVSVGATVAPASGVAQDFSLPVVYTVTAEDGTTQAYEVTVTFGSRTLLGAVSLLAGSSTGAGYSDGAGGAARFVEPEGVAIDDAHTTLYVTDIGNELLRKIVIATGAVSTVAGSPGAWGSSDGTGSAARFSWPAGICWLGGSLYIADRNNHAVRKVDPATGAVSTLAGGQPGSADGTGSAATFSVPWGIATDGTYLYVTDSGNSTIRKIVPSTGAVTTIAGAAGSTGTADGTGSAARFLWPAGLATDGTNLYVADRYNHTIRVVALSSGVVSTLAGVGETAGFVDGTGSTARLTYPYGLVLLGSSLYVTDAYNNCVRRIVTSTGEVSTVTGSPGAGGTAGGTWADGSMSSARFSDPRGICTDGSSLYVVDLANHALRTVDLGAQTVSTLCGSPPTNGSTDGTAGSARFFQPLAVAGDGQHLYISDTLNRTIRSIDKTTAQVTTLAGAPGQWGSTDGAGSAARFQEPAGITVVGTVVFVADRSSHTIRRIDAATGGVTTMAGYPNQAGSTDGNDGYARFSAPQGIAGDTAFLYVADTGNHTIRRISIATAEVTTLAGTAGQYGTSDGTGAAARFNTPKGIAVGRAFLYVADTGNYAIRRVDKTTGVVSTFAGTAGQYGTSDGAGAYALFAYPEGIACDGVSLYVADTNVSTIRSIALATRQVATLAGVAALDGNMDGSGASARFYLPSGIWCDAEGVYVADTNNHAIRKIE